MSLHNKATALVFSGVEISEFHLDFCLVNDTSVPLHVRPISTRPAGRTQTWSPFSQATDAFRLNGRPIAP